jgi:FtsH-binding integral membrane protein
MARQVGSALGVAIVVAVYASPSPHSLAAFRRGWVLGVIAVLLASVASLVVRSSPAALPPSARGQGKDLVRAGRHGRRA